MGAAFGCSWVRRLDLGGLPPRIRSQRPGWILAALGRELVQWLDLGPVGSCIFDVRSPHVRACAQTALAHHLVKREIVTQLTSRVESEVTQLSRFCRCGYLAESAVV